MFNLFKKRTKKAPMGVPGKTAQHVLPADQIFIHATHPKAGSQWVQAIISDLFASNAIPNLSGNGHPPRGKFEAGQFYLSVYLSPDEIDSLCDHPSAARPIFVMRDLRDTLVSLYFSLKVSHKVLDEFMAAARVRLNRLNEEDGLVYLIESQLRNSAKLQKAWIARDAARCVKFETLTANAEHEMTVLLRDSLGLEIPADAISASCAKFAFERLTGGRTKGEEDAKSHFRSGAAGGWRKHFSPAVCEAFKEEFPGLLQLTGYEPNDDWTGSPD